MQFSLALCCFVSLRLKYLPRLFGSKHLQYTGRLKSKCPVRFDYNLLEDWRESENVFRIRQSSLCHLMRCLIPPYFHLHLFLSVSYLRISTCTSSFLSHTSVSPAALAPFSQHIRSPVTSELRNTQNIIFIQGGAQLRHAILRVHMTMTGLHIYRKMV
jgi:hypothetical protein